MLQDTFWIDLTQIKAKTSKENFFCGTSIPVLQVCEIQITNDKNLKFWASTSILLLYSPFTVQESTASKQNAKYTQKTSMTGFSELY